jgi:hypothetical protein
MFEEKKSPQNFLSWQKTSSLRFKKHDITSLSEYKETHSAAYHTKFKKIKDKKNMKAARLTLRGS